VQQPLLCARQILTPFIERTYPDGRMHDRALESIRVFHEPHPELGAAGATIHRLEYHLRTPVPEVVFSFSPQSACHALAGDVQEVTTLPHEWGMDETFSLTAYNALLVTQPAPPQQPDVLSYVQAVLRLIHPRTRVLFPTAAADLCPAAAECTAKVRRKLHRYARELAAPEGRCAAGGFCLGTMNTWQDPGGVLGRVRFVVWPDGRIALQRSRIALRVGPYADFLRIIM
jgi:hypothetical protein